jgi:hypothetical protein
MSRLSPEAEQLLRAGRAVLRPSDTDRERVLSGLLQRTGNVPDAGAGTTEPSCAAAASKLTLWKATGALAGLVVVGAGAFFALRPEPAATPAPAPSATATAKIVAAVEGALPASAEKVLPSAPTELAEQPAPQRSEESPSVTPPRAPAKRRAQPRAGDSLAREVALLSRASSELHAARHAAALQALDQHARRFPDGVLSQERAAARARALCALGRTSEAQVELAKLVAGSPHAARAAQACASASSERK